MFANQTKMKINLYLMWTLFIRDNGGNIDATHRLWLG